MNLSCSRTHRTYPRDPGPNSMSTGRGAGGGGGGGGKKKATAAAAPAWKKPPGASLSAKAKKEYLQWKREQKRNQADDDDSDGDRGPEAGGGGGADDAPQAGRGAATAVAVAAAAARGGGRAGAGRAAGWGQQLPHHHERQQPRAGPTAATAARDSPLPDDDSGDGNDDDDDGGDGGGADSAAGDGGGAAAHPQQQPRGGGGGGGGGGRAVPDDLSLRYVPMVALPPGDVPQCIRSVCGEDVAAMQLARVREDEVGFTEEGRRLGMPKRPNWRVGVRNAQQLHRLEERSFQAWVDRMYASVDDPSRISFFEPKLDFWRQLWRVLERSDVAVMIVDARNPLLHFSEALAHHVMDDHGIPALLVLNKCDLVPASCVERWRSFFEGRYPGLRVVASSASCEGSRAAAEAIMDALLDCTVTRDGQRLKVSQVVQMGRDEILAASKARNTHSKRDRPQPHQQQQQQQAVAASAAGEASGGEAGTSAENADTGAESAANGGDEDEDEEVAGWELKGNKAKKKAAVRRKRNQRMHGGGAGSGVGIAAEATGGRPRAGTGGRKTAGAPAAAAASAAAVGPTRGSRGGGRGRGSCADEENEDEDAEGQRQEGTSVGGGRETEDAGGDEDDVDDSDNDNDNAAFEQMLADEEAAVGLLQSEETGDEDEDQEAEVEEQQQRSGRTTAGGGGGWGGHGARGGRDGRGRSRPVVVCVVGEPNVGKSSTLNALLGAKRVAVSSHPGRTKHYQTHLMCPSLMLCDCPGLVFPRLDVSLQMQVLFGSYPIARCRDAYAVVRYLAERVWPRLHVTLRLKPVREQEREREEGELEQAGGATDRGEAAPECRDQDWTPLALCEALAARHSWRSRRGGRLDVYRAANWILRSALAGRNGVDVAFLPPEGDEEGEGEQDGNGGQSV